jgi:hypothetical protein
MNEYLAAKEQTKSAMKSWYIFAPVWFVTSIIAMVLADAIQDKYRLIATLLRFVPLIAIPAWIYVVVRLGGFQAPNHLKCQKCKAPAFNRSFDIDWKFEGPTRDFIDICPNCGNDNREDIKS